MAKLTKELMMLAAVPRAEELLGDAKNERLSRCGRYGCACLGLWFLGDCEFEIEWNERRYDPERWDVTEQELNTLVTRLELRLMKEQEGVAGRMPTVDEAVRAAEEFEKRAVAQGLIEPPHPREKGVGKGKRAIARLQLREAADPSQTLAHRYVQACYGLRVMGDSRRYDTKKAPSEADVKRVVRLLKSRLSR